MLVLDDLPFSHVEDMGFMRLMFKAVPQYRLKDCNFYYTMICTEIYDAVWPNKEDATWYYTYYG